YKTKLLSGAATTGTVKIDYGSDSDPGLDKNLVIAQSTSQSGKYKTLGNNNQLGNTVTSNYYNPLAGDYLALADVNGPYINVVNEGNISQNGLPGQTIFMATLKIDKFGSSNDAFLTGLLIKNRLQGAGSPAETDIDSVHVYLDSDNNPSNGKTLLASGLMLGTNGGQSDIRFDSLRIATLARYLHVYYKTSASAVIGTKIGFEVENKSAFTFLTGGDIPASTFPIFSSNDATLPVELVRGSFIASKVKGGFEITAQTASEDNVKYILIQRRMVFEDAEQALNNQWITINRIESSAMYSTSGRQLPATVDQIDLKLPINSLYYRIITEELNGFINENLNNNIIEIDKDLISLTEFRLAQNYPNPFNPSTVISFDVPYQSRISIHIYNILGQLVKRLIDNQLYEAGKSYSVKWDGINDSGNKVASGMYIYRFTDEKSNTVFTKKMMLIK
ncbi:MAG: T9SS type A sorting domain-containing protein, partial [Calditrichaeota bacterium]|nr:T9SS type A sorting domain-containing protein [Calditrichota bacterium]